MLDDAVIFAKVVECGNFSKAARDLGITPAAVSKKIMRIEKSLDASLLYRNTRGVQLTSQGQAYYRLMRQALNTSIEAEQAVRELSTSMNGLIRIAAGPSFTCHVLAPALARFVSTYPDISVHVTVTTSPISAASEGADIMFQWGELKDSELIGKQIMTDTLVSVCSPQYFKEHGFDAASREDIFKHFIALTDNYAPASTIPPSFGRDEFVLSRIVVDDIAAVLALVVAGGGVTRLPRYAVREHIARGTLVEIETAGDVQIITGNAIFHSPPTQNPRISEFMKYVTEVIAQLMA
jgi:DNA-binding transcriptional LysR family regulator